MHIIPNGFHFLLVFWILEQIKISVVIEKLTGKQSLCLGKPHGNTQYGVICSGTQFFGCQIKDEKIEPFVLLKHFGILSCA
jgi:hypothetical protein